ncbi:Kelch motif [Saitoella coloradoensis]
MSSRKDKEGKHRESRHSLAAGLRRLGIHTKSSGKSLRDSVIVAETASLADRSLAAPSDDRDHHHEDTHSPALTTPGMTIATSDNDSIRSSNSRNSSRKSVMSSILTPSRKRIFGSKEQLQEISRERTVDTAVSTSSSSPEVGKDRSSSRQGASSLARPDTEGDIEVSGLRPSRHTYVPPPPVMVQTPPMTTIPGTAAPMRRNTETLLTKVPVSPGVAPASVDRHQLDRKGSMVRTASLRHAETAPTPSTRPGLSTNWSSVGDRDRERDRNTNANNKRPDKRKPSRQGSGATSIAEDAFRRDSDILGNYVPGKEEILPAPSCGMYWSRPGLLNPNSNPNPNLSTGPILGQRNINTRKPIRAHTVNVVGSSLWVFGGCDQSTCFNKVEVFDGDTMSWGTPTLIGDPPPPCRAHTATLVNKTQIVVFGGGDGPRYNNDVYTLDTSNHRWSKPEIAEGPVPSPRRAHTACYRANKNEVIVFGGGDGIKALNDLWSLECGDIYAPMRWTQLHPGGKRPISRGYHTANLVGEKMVVLGGSDGHECFSDCHVLDLGSMIWHRVDISPSPSPDHAFPRLSHTSTQVGSYLFIIGGHDGSTYSSDVLLFNLVTLSWEKRRLHGHLPAGRGYHTCALYDSRLFVIGGFDGHDVFDEVSVLELAGFAYLPQINRFSVEL